MSYRVYDLARELNVKNIYLLEILKGLNISVFSHMSTLSEKNVDFIKSNFSDIHKIIENKFKLQKLHVQNYCSLSDISITSKNLNVFFGPNGSGKTSFLDAILFIRDCAVNGVDQASSNRSHGIGILWDGADEGSNISIKFETEMLYYKVSFGFSSGRIETFVGENLYSKKDNIRIIDRKIGSNKVFFHSSENNKKNKITLKEPEKLALTMYVNSIEGSEVANNIDKILQNIRFYSARAMDIHVLKKYGSESNYHTELRAQCENLWSVLRNIHDSRRIDERYNCIIKYMQESFPSFKDLYIQQTGPNTVYGSFVEKNLRHPINASGVSDGHIQMLILLTALFSEDNDIYHLILFDEPEISLHPYALSIFAKAVKYATETLNRQVYIATHSPVLLSQFEPDDIFSTEKKDSGETVMTRVSDIKDIKLLLEEYALGSLYMAEAIAAQSISLSEK